MFIKKATVDDVQTIMDIGRISFMESHSSSAPLATLEHYLNTNFTPQKVEEELADPTNIFHIIYHNEIPAGYSKICLDHPHPNINTKKVTKLERIYLLKEYCGLKLGYELFRFNVELSKANLENGLWLFVWIHNKKAINFYQKTGFKIIGAHNFPLSKDHSNPNHQMLLEY